MISEEVSTPKKKTTGKKKVGKGKKTPKRNSITQTTIRKRDALIKNVRIKKNAEGTEEAIRRLKEYLETHHKKYTVERETVLSKLYQLSTPVDIDTLHKLLESDGFYVSLATVYNTLQLLVNEIHLVRRIDLNSGKMSFYEKVTGNERQFYLVCNKCGSLIATPYNTLWEKIHRICPKQFKVDDISLLVTGYCNRCQMAIRKAEQRRQEKERAKKENAKSKTIETNK